MSGLTPHDVAETLGNPEDSAKAGSGSAANSLQASGAGVLIKMFL